MILPKNQMSEEDIKRVYITPAIEKNGVRTRLQWKQRLSLRTEKLT